MEPSEDDCSCEEGDEGVEGDVGYCLGGGYRFGTELHLDGVTSGGHIHGSQHVVGTDDGAFGAIDGGAPSGVVYLGEYYDTTIL